MEPETKKRKIFRPPPRRKITSKHKANGQLTIITSSAAAPSATEKKDPAVSAATVKSAVNVAKPGVVVDLRIQQAKNHAIAQAQQDGSKANFRIFDSPFGNFLVPVVPTRAELGG